MSVLRSCRALSAATLSAILVAAALFVTACSEPAGSVAPPGSPGPASVIVAPNAVGFGLGVGFPLTATVLDSAGVPTANQAVTWSITPSDGPISVSDSGVVFACYPGGTAIVTARSVQDTVVAGTDTLVAVSDLLPAISMTAIDQALTGAPAHLDSVTDSIAVLGNAAPSTVPCRGLTEVDLVLRRASGDTVIDRVIMDSTSRTSSVVRLVFHSDATVAGAPVFPNGDYALRLDVHITGMLAPQPSITINITIRNP